MNTKTIAFTASEQTLVKTSGADAYASNTVGYIEATFDLDTNWDGFDSVRAVWKSQYYTISAVLDAYGKCLVPAEVKYYKSKVFANLVGSNVEDDVLVDRLTTYPILAFTIDAEAEVEGTETTDITPSQFEQFVDQVEGYAESAAEDAQSIAESAAQIEQNAEDIADLKEEINDKPNWTVGSAEQLVSDEASASDVTPYTFRRSGGGLIPFNFTREELAKVVGGTVAWNQLYGKHSGCAIKSGDSVNITATVDSDGYANISGTPNATTVIEVTNSPGGSAMPANNVCLLLCDGKMDGMEWGRIGFGYTTNSYYMNKHNAEFNCGARIRLTANTTYNIKVRFSTYNLTRLFSSPTIADYIYSLETATAGTGIAFFKKLFPNQYYAPDAGSLQSVCVGAHSTTGKNLFGGVHGTDNKYKLFMPKGTEFTVSCNSGSNATYIYFYDENLTRIDYFSLTQTADGRAYRTFTRTHDIYYFAFGNYDNGDEQIAFGSDYTYHPYQKHTYALDGTKTLRGRFYLDSNNQLRADGDIYLPSGEVDRRYAVVDLGSLTYTYSSTSNVFLTNITNNHADKVFGNLVCPLYVMVDNNDYSNWANLSMRNTNTQENPILRIKNTAYTDPATFKTAMSGVYLVYELANPTTESADPYTAVQICDSDGTEEFVDALVEAGTRDVAIPAGTETVYYEDMAGKLAELPPIPSAPSANGTYTLQAVVSSGAVTYQWTS